MGGTELATRQRVFWMVTPACPSRCIYCGIGEHQGQKTLTCEQVVRVAREVVDAGFQEVILGGGEALTYVHLLPLLETVRDHTTVALFSGGVPGMTERCVDLIGQGVDRVVFSMDGPDASLNDRLRGRPGITRAVRALAEGVRSRHPHVGVSFNTVVSRHNCDRLLELLDVVLSFDPHGWALTLVGDNFGIRPGGDLPDRDQLRRLYFETIPEIARRVADRPRFDLVTLPLPVALLPARRDATRWRDLAARAEAAPAIERDLAEFARGNHNRTFASELGCPLIGSDIGISASGAVYPCSGFPTFHGAYELGDLRETSLADILAGDRLARFRDRFPSEACSRCWAPSNIQPTRLDELLDRLVS